MPVLLVGSKRGQELKIDQFNLQRPLSFSKKNLDGKIFHYILWDSQMWTILIEAVTPLSQALCF